MKAVVIAALIAITLTGSTRGLPEAQNKQPGLSFVSQATTTRQLGPCDEERWLRITPKEWTPQLVKGLIRCAIRRWPVEGGAAKAIAVAQCESGLYPEAIGGDNLGVFQHKASLWFGRTNTYLRSRWFNRAQWSRIHQAASVTHPQPAFVARANVMIAARMVHNGGWSPWSCA